MSQLPESSSQLEPAADQQISTSSSQPELHEQEQQTTASPEFHSDNEETKTSLPFRFPTTVVGKTAAIVQTSQTESSTSINASQPVEEATTESIVGRLQSQSELHYTETDDADQEQLQLQINSADKSSDTTTTEPSPIAMATTEHAHDHIDLTSTTSAEQDVAPTRKRKKQQTSNDESSGIDKIADEFRNRIVSGNFPSSHPLHNLRGSRLLFLDTAKCPQYSISMESQTSCCLSYKCDRFVESSLPSFHDFSVGYTRHPAIFEGAIKYMFDAKQTYAFQWLLGHNRLMAIPSNALDGNFSPLCLERGVMTISGFVTEKVSKFHLIILIS
jgi:hypothetical protein